MSAPADAHGYIRTAGYRRFVALVLPRRTSRAITDMKFL
jgi:hypothetical protein